MRKMPRQSLPNDERGSVLLAALCFATVLAIALTSYQQLCFTTLNTSDRFAQTSHSVELAETGVEYALWSRSNANWTGWTINGSTATVTLSGSDFNFSNGVTGSIALTVTHYNTSGTSTSDVTSVGTVTLPTGSTISRTISTTLQKTEPFSNALAAVGSSGAVLLSSGGLKIDSYNSSTDPTASSPDYGAIVTGPSITMQTGSTIWGYAATPPNSSGDIVLSYSTSSFLLGPSTPAGTKIDPSRKFTSTYQNVFVPPSASGTDLYEPSGDVNLASGTYRLKVTSGFFYVRNGRLIVDGTDVILVAPDGIYIYNIGQIVVKNGGRLRILLQGSAYIYYDGVDNQTKDPSRFTIVGTTSTVGEVMNIYSSTKFYGGVYTPNHDVKLYGYNDSSEIFGAFVGRNVTVNPYNTTTTLRVHFDKDLRTSVLDNLTTPYAVQESTWTESGP